MDFDEILKNIIENYSYLDGGYYTGFDDEQNYEYGAFLYYALSTIKDIENYCFNKLKEENIEISKNDVLTFLFQKEIFKKDYTHLYENIDETVSEADYGNYYFYEDEKKFHTLKDELEELYEEFKSIAE